LQPLGFTTKEKHLGILFSNPFYAGYITDTLIPNEVIAGHHPPLVSKALWERVNNVGNHNTTCQPSRSTIEHPDLPLKAFLKEEETGIPFTGYEVKAKSIAYYKTRERGKAVNLNAKKTNLLFEKVLSMVEIDPSLSTTLEEKVVAKVESLLQEELKGEKTIKAQITQLKGRLQSLETKFLDDLVDVEDYQRLKRSIGTQMADLEGKLGKEPINSSNLQKAVKKGLEISANLSALWASSDFQGKRTLQEMVFPEGIFISKEKARVRTGRLNSVIFCIRDAVGPLEGIKKGKNDFDIIFPSLVAPPGIEPGS
ncbi:MAG: recombinase family protein, partial [Bacteroidota bacterium]|nr:recombinase family protein [Bacteroidota bacterium]MDX5506121.1 recombinase family protein [Bacteroidota bacterium]